MNETPLGDDWKETVSNPGHEHGLPKRPSQIDITVLFGRDVVEFRDDHDGCHGFIRAGEAVNLGDMR
jgi:hypothetical protein